MQPEGSVSLDGRLLRPTWKGRATSWDKVVAQVARRLADIIARHGPASVAMRLSDRLLTEDYYIANKMMKGFIGSADIAIGPGSISPAAGLAAMLGEDIVPATTDDIEQAKLIIVLGVNIRADLPILWRRIVSERDDHGTRVVIIDSRGPDGPEAADLRMTIRPGTEAVLMTGLLAFSWRAGIIDGHFLASHAATPSGFWEALEDGHDLWSTARACDVTPAELQAFYDLFAANPRTVTLFGDGALTGAVVNAHLATGRIGKPGAAPFPLVAVSNAMGAREVGISQDMLAAHMDFATGPIALASQLWGAAHMAGQAAAPIGAPIGPDVRALWLLGDDILSPADAELVEQAQASGLFVIHARSLADGILADAHLPSVGWGEQNGTSTGFDRMISRQRPFFPAAGEARPHWWITTQVARAMGWRDAFYFDHPADVYREHARLSAYRNDGARLFSIRRHAAISNPAYDEMTSWRWGGAPFTDGRFQTSDGKARLMPVEQVLPSGAGKALISGA